MQPFEGRKLAMQALRTSDLIGTMPAFNCLYLADYFSDRAEICRSLLFLSALSEFKAKIKILKTRLL